MTQIILKNVAKIYQVGSETIPAVQAVSLSIEKGDFISVVGHSGSGKTTLLSLIGGITNPTSGNIYFDGTDISSLQSDLLSEYRSAKIGFMFQFASLLPMLTVRENLMLPTVFHEQIHLKTQAARRAEELIRMVGLSEKIDRYPSQLSGGQQRRIAIARAFMNQPAVVLADEPTGDLDEDTEKDMMNFFKRMNSDNGITFIMVTHNRDLANQAMRQITMHQGKIQEK